MAFYLKNANSEIKYCPMDDRYLGLPCGLHGWGRIERDTSVNCGAQIRLRFDIEIPIHKGQTLLHANEAKSQVLLYSFTIKAGPGITHAEPNLIRHSPQAHDELFCAAVFCRIMKGLLRYPEKRKGNVRRQGSGYIIAFEIDFHMLPLAKFPAEAFHGGGDSQIVQSCRVQFMR